MQLAHYSSEGFQFDPTMTYDNTVQRYNRKPNGFWVSVVGKDDWLSWCQAEGFATDRRVEHNVRLSEEANIWLIDSPEAFLSFERLYRTLDRPFEDSNYTRSTIDWMTLVEQGFDGIIIAPYRWEFRFRDEGALLIHGHTHSDVRFQGREACVSWEAWGRLVGTGDLLPWLRLPWRPEVIEP